MSRIKPSASLLTFWPGKDCPTDLLECVGLQHRGHARRQGRERARSEATSRALLGDAPQLDSVWEPVLAHVRRCRLCPILTRTCDAFPSRQGSRALRISSPGYGEARTADCAHLHASCQNCCAEPSPGRTRSMQPLLGAAYQQPTGKQDAVPCPCQRISNIGRSTSRDPLRPLRLA